MGSKNGDFGLLFLVENDKRVVEFEADKKSNDAKGLSKIFLKNVIFCVYLVRETEKLKSSSIPVGVLKIISGDFVPADGNNGEGEELGENFFFLIRKF